MFFIFMWLGSFLSQPTQAGVGQQGTCTSGMVITTLDAQGRPMPPSRVVCNPTPRATPTPRNVVRATATPVRNVVPRATTVNCRDWR